MAQHGPSDSDRTVQRRLSEGEAAALGEAYDRFASLVHGLALRVLVDDAAANRITSEVFTRLWEHPEAYDPDRGPLRSWLAELTHRLAVQRLRATRAATLAMGGEGDDAAGLAELERTVRKASVAARADYLMTSMPVHLRTALELVHFKRHDCRHTAAELDISEAETHHRLRLGLQLMARAYDTGPMDPPPDHGTLPSEPAPSPGPGRAT